MKPTGRSLRSRSAGRRTSGRAQGKDIIDPYQARQKPSEPTVCSKCGAVYRHGRWQWGHPTENAQAARCPACRRIDDQLPAGVVTLHGAFAREHKTEIMGVAHNEEMAEKGEHPLNRIMGIEESEEGLVINTTDIHLPRRIGEAVKRAFHGTLDMQFDDASYFVRVDWRAPD
jgi:NMD protein affecting ribosome stability and mRNA decay